MHCLNCYEEIKLVDDVLTRLVYTTWQDLTLLVYKETENGDTFARNLYCSMYNRYLVAFPGEKMYHLYYSNQYEVLQDWEQTRPLPVGRARELSPEEVTLITSRYHDFKYMLQKNRITTCNVMSYLAKWKVYPGIELLLMAGATRVVETKKFYRLTEKKQKEVIQWILKNKEIVKNPTLQEIQYCVKWKIVHEEFLRVYRQCTVNSLKLTAYDIFCYMEKLAHGDFSLARINNLYRDYCRMAKEAGHNMKDKYWKFPKDLTSAHAKVLHEVNEIFKAQEKKKMMEIEKSLEPVVNEYSKYNAVIKGYSIFLTSNMDKWNYQAETLHQCIMRCKYYNKMIERKELIVFIQQKEKPIATAEIFPNKKLGQFYADEIGGISNSRPSKKVEKIFNEWLERLPDNLLNEKSC